MNMILKLGAGALIASMAIAAAGCAKSGAPPHSAGAASVFPSPLQLAEDKMPRINVEEARKLVAEGKAVIIDVRGIDAYKTSHIKGALEVPMKKLEAGDVTDLPKDKRIIAYCACPAENSSARAALLLQQKGFNDASALLGGLTAWEKAGGPMEKPAPTPESSKKKK